MKKLNIIYEDKHLIVIDKETKLLTIASNKEKEKTLYHLTSLYVKKQHKSNKIFIVHRLDFETSGLIVFAKSEKVQKYLQDNWDKTIRKYYGIVYGKMKKQDDRINLYLKENNFYQVYVTNDKKNGKEAITEYKVLKETKKYSLLDINILTGRKNQIRVTMSYLNNPLVGDKLYNKDNQRRLFLHAYYLSFKHPITNNIMEFTSKYPITFNNLIKYEK